MRVTVAIDPGQDKEFIREALETSGHEVTFRIADSNFPYNITGDIVFNASNSYPGRHGNAFIPSVLEGMGVPYTGPDALTSAVCQDHISLRILLSKGNIRTPRYVFLNSPEDVPVIKDQRFTFPIVYRHNYSSKGESVVYYGDAEEFFSDVGEYAYDMFWPAVVDEYKEGREIVAYGYGHGKDFQMTRPLEIVYSGEIFDDEARTSCEFRMPQLTRGERSALHESCYRAHHIMGVDGWSRIDLKLGTDHLPIVLEIDPNPSFDHRAEASLKASNLTKSDIINYIINSAAHKVKESNQEERQHLLFPI